MCAKNGQVGINIPVVVVSKSRGKMLKGKLTSLLISRLFCLRTDTLGIEENLIQGSLPTELGLLSSLRLATMRSNLMTGTIPPEIGNLASLSVFKVEQNSLFGDMPSTVCALRTPNGILSQLTADCDMVSCFGGCCTNC